MRVLLTAMLLVGTVVGAQAPAPTLTEMKKLQLRNITQRMEIAQLRAQAAQRDFEGAREELMKVLGTVKVEGYTLDLGTLVYQKEQTPAK